MSSRYYDDKEAEIVPGKISDELRAALNLAENDVPVWIYRMRALGYPPGWLSKAIVDTSDIFDTDEPKAEGSSGKRKNSPLKNSSVQYDHSKLIEYPGFNTPMPANAHDYHYYHNMPPMLPHQQLDYAKKTMNAFTPAPMPAKRIRTASPSSNNNTLNSSLGDKNASQDDTTASNNLDTPASPDASNDDEKEEDDDVEDGDSDGSSPAQTDDNNLDKTSTESVNTRVKSESTTPAGKAVNQSTSSITGEIKLVSKGSPMPQNVKRLPLERFSEGVVGDILYFENIPNSTGKFESIRGLLNTMRRSKSETDTSFGANSIKHNASTNSLRDEEGQDQ